MEYKVNQLGDSIQEIEVNLKYEEILPDIEKAYEEERKNITLDGFRKGKAPLPLIKKYYGDAIEHEATEKIANKKFWEIADKENINPIDTPVLTHIDYQKGSSLSFKIKYEVYPNIEVKNYKNLEIEKPTFKVKDEEIEKEVNYYINANAKYETADIVENNNYRITVNLQRVDAAGIPIIGQRTENIIINLDDESVNTQIIQNALGKKTGEKFPFHFVDEHYHGSELHREEYFYEAEITKIEKKILPEVNEDFIKKITNEKATTIDQWKELIKTNIQKFYDYESDEIFINNLLTEIVKNNDFTPPQSVVESLQKNFLEQEKEKAKRYRHKIDEHAVYNQLKTKAEWNAKWQIIFQNIAKAENIVVEDSDLEKLAKEESESTGISIDKLIKYYKDTNRSYYILEDKVIKFLKENNRIKEIDSETYIKEKKEKQNEERTQPEL